MENRIKNVMCDVLDIDLNKIVDESSPESIESWDSLKHMNLIVALEDEFDFEFSDEDIENLLNFKLIKITIDEKLS